MHQVSENLDRLRAYLRCIRDFVPLRSDVERQQRLLAMYRSLLAEYLRQHQQWERTEVPGYLSAGISVLRGHILEIKGALRGWKIEVDDHPDDEGPDDDIGDEVQHQRGLLKIYRRNLATYLQNQKQFPTSQVPPMLINSLENTRTEIQRIKGILRGYGVAVDDLPEEEIE